MCAHVESREAISIETPASPITLGNKLGGAGGFCILNFECDQLKRTTKTKTKIQNRREEHGALRTTAES